MSQRVCKVSFPQYGRHQIKGYLFYEPDWTSQAQSRPLPLVLFLHGAMECGNDPEMLKRTALPSILETNHEFPFLVVSPQCPRNSQWQWQTANLSKLLEYICTEYPIDESRIYLTGLSLGGCGVWVMAVTYPKRFAALAPVCGYGPKSFGFPKRVCALCDTPIWVFHGTRDQIVPIKESIKLVSELKACGGNVRFTVYPEAGHDAWTETYHNPELYLWLLSHRRR